MNSHEPDFSIVILTYNREKYLKQQLPDLTSLPRCEIIVVDNCSDDNYSERLSADYDNTKVVRLDKNYGAVGRNYGIERAVGKYIITLDDDVWGITEAHLNIIQARFEANARAAALCFKVIDEGTQRITNWCHRCDPELFSSQTFETYEISEGAVAFKRKSLEKVGLYPLEFFISHEGPDLAFRILNASEEIYYAPEIVVTHAHAQEGRKSWRRYYFDTRNLIWLAYRNYNLRMLCGRFPLQMLAMLIYSLRDGFLFYFFKGVVDGVKGIWKSNNWRHPITAAAFKEICRLDQNKPSLLYYLRHRVFKREVKI